MAFDIYLAFGLAKTIGLAKKKKKLVGMWHCKEKTCWPLAFGIRHVANVAFSIWHLEIGFAKDDNLLGR